MDQLTVVVSRNVSVCRICLNLCDKSQNMLLSDVKWSEMYEFCCGIAVTTNDTTKLLCSNCKLTLEQNAEFKRKCIRSDSLLRSLVKKKESKVNNESLKDEGDNKQTIADIFETNMKPEHECEDQIDNNNLQPNQNIPETCNEPELTHLDMNIKNEAFDCNDVDYFTDDGTIENNIDPKSEVEAMKVSNQIETFTEFSTKTKTKCKYCQKMYVSGIGINAHMKKCKKKVEKESVPIVDCFSSCGLCDFKSDSGAVKEHLQTHFDRNELACKLCSFVGGELSEIGAHRYTHIENHENIRAYKCHICDMMKRKLSLLEFHYKEVHISNGVVVCNVCKAEFKNKMSYRSHLKYHRKQDFICDHCGRNFGYKSNLAQHLHHVMRKTNYFCDKCGKLFTKQYNFNMHVLSWHTASTPVKCQHCSKMYKNQYSLDNHLKRLVKNYTCDVCSKKFAKPCELTKHQIWHSDLKPFKCEKCDGAFKAKDHLKVHMRSHMGYFPFKCNDCEKGFTVSSALKRHRSVHTGVRSFKCKMCTRSFHLKGLLRKHCEKAHNVKGEV